ncbi:MAG: chromate transporter [Clostridiales Family XIII bacterium]|nr:chromate transporter [Clostridiales Family XIII bacterium]
MGLPGAFIASLSFILPSVIIVSLLAYLYRGYSDLPVIQNALSCVRPAATGLRFNHCG